MYERGVLEDRRRRFGKKKRTSLTLPVGGNLCCVSAGVLAGDGWDKRTALAGHFALREEC